MWASSAPATTLESPAMALNYRIGDEPVPGFRLERFLGRGAIGEVWHASGPGGTERR